MPHEVEPQGFCRTQNIYYENYVYDLYALKKPFGFCYQSNFRKTLKSFTLMQANFLKYSNTEITIAL